MGKPKGSRIKPSRYHIGPPLADQRSLYVSFKSGVEFLGYASFNGLANHAMWMQPSDIDVFNVSEDYYVGGKRSNE